MKKLTLDDILKHGAKITARKLNSDDLKMIEHVKKQQEEILNMAKVDWNNPNLRRPMDI